MSTLTTARRLMAPLVAMLVVAGGCSGADPDGYERADRILASAGLDASGSVEGENDTPAMAGACSLEIREDEYGMTFEVCVADSSTPAQPIEEVEPEVAGAQQSREESEPEPEPDRTTQTDVLPIERFDELASLIAAGPAADALANVSVALQDMDSACAESPEAWAESIPVLNEVLLSAAPLVRELSDYRESAEARELARSLIERVALQTGCEQAAVGGEATAETTVPGLLEAASSATAAAEPLYQALWGTDKSPYFYHSDELAHRRWMRDEGAVDMVVVGTSQALLGIEPDLLAEQFGVGVGSVALPGAVAEVQQHWLPEVMLAASPEVVLWGFGPLDLVSACRPDGRADEFRRLAVLKGDLLAPFAWADDVDPVDRLLGPQPESSHDETPTGVTAATRFPHPRGDAFEFANADPAQITASLEQFRAPFERGDFCSDRLVVVRKIIEALEADGRRVVIFGMPLAPELAATYDGGRDALQQLVDEAASDVFQPAGAEYMGMMRSIDDAGGGYWYDVVHPTRAGGTALSAEVASAFLALDQP